MNFKMNLNPSDAYVGRINETGPRLRQMSNDLYQPFYPYFIPYNYVPYPNTIPYSVQVPEPLMSVELNNSTSVSASEPRSKVQVEYWDNLVGRYDGQSDEKPNCGKLRDDVYFTQKSGDAYLVFEKKSDYINHFISYYFSDRNLQRDNKLRDLMDGRGVVPLSALVQFPKLNKVETTVDDLVDAMNNNLNLTLSESESGEQGIKRKVRHTMSNGSDSIISDSDVSNASGNTNSNHINGGNNTIVSANNNNLGTINNINNSAGISLNNSLSRLHYSTNNNHPGSVDTNLNTPNSETNSSSTVSPAIMHLFYPFNQPPTASTHIMSFNHAQTVTSVSNQSNIQPPSIHQPPYSSIIHQGNTVASNNPTYLLQYSPNTPISQHHYHPPPLSQHHQNQHHHQHPLQHHNNTNNNHTPFGIYTQNQELLTSAASISNSTNHAAYITPQTYSLQHSHNIVQPSAPHNYPMYAPHIVANNNSNTGSVPGFTATVSAAIVTPQHQHTLQPTLNYNSNTNITTNSINNQSINNRSQVSPIKSNIQNTSETNSSGTEDSDNNNTNNTRLSSLNAGKESSSSLSDKNNDAIASIPTSDSNNNSNNININSKVNVESN